MAKQRLFFLIKPDGMLLKEKIISMVKTKANILDSKILDPADMSKIEKLYEMHKGKFFYDRLLNYFREQSINALLLEEKENYKYKKNFIYDFIELVGDTDPIKAKIGTIRSISNDSIEKSMSESRAVKNLVHRSTNIEEAEREAKIFFNYF